MATEQVSFTIMNNLQCFSIYPRDSESFPHIPKLCIHKTVIPERPLKYLEQMRQKQESSDDLLSSVLTHDQSTAFASSFKETRETAALDIQKRGGGCLHCQLCCFDCCLSVHLCLSLSLSLCLSLPPFAWVLGGCFEEIIKHKVWIFGDGRKHYYQ